jgi:hypothetical protein
MPTMRSWNTVSGARYECGDLRNGGNWCRGFYLLYYSVGPGRDEGWRDFLDP